MIQRARKSRIPNPGYRTPADRHALTFYICAPTMCRMARRSREDRSPPGHARFPRPADYQCARPAPRLRHRAASQAGLGRGARRAAGFAVSRPAPARKARMAPRRVAHDGERRDAKFYTLTAEGKKRLAAERSEWDRVSRLSRSCCTPHIGGRVPRRDEIDKEIAFHIESRVDDPMAGGLTREEAARRARLELAARCRCARRSATSTSGAPRMACWRTSPWRFARERDARRLLRRRTRRSRARHRREHGDVLDCQQPCAADAAGSASRIGSGQLRSREPTGFRAQLPGLGTRCGAARSVRARGRVVADRAGQPRCRASATRWATAFFASGLVLRHARRLAAPRAHVR